MRFMSIGAVLCLVGCSPALDWREVRPEGTALTALFPCKPAVQTRRVELPGVAADMTMYACTAQDTVFAVSHADVVDPTAVNTVLATLLSTARDNVSGVAVARQPALVPGMTPYPGAVAVEITGSRPDGGALVIRTSVFAHGTRVFQASVHARHLDPSAGEPFFGALRLGP